MNAPRTAIPTLHDTDRSEILDHLCACDPRLDELVREVGHCEINLSRYQSLYEALLRAIVYQQLAGKAAAAIMRRVQRLFVPDGTPDDALPYPTPEQIDAASIEHLRTAGLSEAKAKAVKDLAAKTLDGTVPTLEHARTLSDEELIERLTAVRGIGRWTVEMMLIFHLGRLDVLPVADYGVRKGFALTYRMRTLPTPKQMQHRAERWKPYRSVASWFMWRAIEVDAQKNPGKRRKLEEPAKPTKQKRTKQKKKAIVKKQSATKSSSSRSKKKKTK